MTDTPTSATTPVPPPSNAGPKGFGGWLILPLLQLAVTPLLALKDLVAILVDPDARIALGALFRSDLPQSLRDAISFGAASLLLALTAIIFCVVCLIQFLQKKSTIPIWMTELYVFAIFYCGFEWYGTSRMTILVEPEDVTVAAASFFVSLLRGVIFIAYFWSSKRVRNTFVN